MQRVGNGIAAAALGGALLGLCAIGGFAAGKPAPADSAASAAAPTAQETEFFETRVRPVLFEKCFACHGETQQSGSLRLDSLTTALKGGASGPAIVPGDPEHSLIIKAVHFDTALKMPPTGKLKPDEIAALTTWVKMGAPWPAVSAPLTPAMAAAKTLWSLQPVRKPALPPVKNAAWCRTPIDRFILAKLEAKGLKPEPAADRRTLIRRAYFDLIGLPPTPAETDAFIADRSPDAWAKVIDRLLADSRYGERWGRHWLDVARYADSKGYAFTEDPVYHNAYTYRDYVIRSFNEDLPYDQFLMQQIAADRLPLGDDKRSLAALGFLTLGRRFLNDPVLINDDRIDVTMRGLQGFTVGCARCHNHKFDPIPQKDYYSLYGIFASSIEPNPPIPISPKSITQPYEEHNAKILAADKERDDLVRAQVTRLRQMGKANPKAFDNGITALLQSIREEQLPDDGQAMRLSAVFEQDARQKYLAIRDNIAELNKTMPPKPEFAMALEETGRPFDAYVFLRGNPGNRGDSVPRQYLAVLSGPDRKPFADGGRLELAKMIASPTNPLTARVFVNRVWLNHFVNGIVRTPSDFGMRGELPTHPELLDWLAYTFMQPDESAAPGGDKRSRGNDAAATPAGRRVGVLARCTTPPSAKPSHHSAATTSPAPPPMLTVSGCGWSIKKLQRLIMLSSVYQMQSNGDPHAFAVDPENRLLSHQNRQRLDLEGLRDSLIYVSGQMDGKIGGPAVEITTAPYSLRRTVYGYIDRQNLQSLYRTFDFATPDVSSAQRFHTTVPQQALFMMNSPFVVERAKAVEMRPDIAAEKSDIEKIRAVYRLLFDRVPAPDEIALGESYLRQPDVAPTAPAWQYGFGGFDAASGRVVGFTPFNVFRGGSWHPGQDIPDPALGFVNISASGGHPGRDLAHAAVRRWTAPYDAFVSITGSINHPTKQGDGVQARIVSSRGGELGSWLVHNEKKSTNVEKVLVKRGDTIDFVVDCHGDDSFDSFAWAPTINAQPANAQTVDISSWSAEGDFSGPAQAKRAPLTAWDRYVQVLLMTNEFSFVD